MDINKDTVFIHYGAVFDTEKFKEIKNANTPWVKPNGGYWHHQLNPTMVGKIGV